MRYRLLAVFCAVLALACAHRGGPQPPLYEQLGERAGIETVVDTLLGLAAADERLAGCFAGADLERLRVQLADQICAAAGGPCAYEGLDMETAHKGLGVTDAQFDALVDDLAAALEEHQVEPPAARRLLRALAPLRDQIVGR